MTLLLCTLWEAAWTARDAVEAPPAPQAMKECSSPPQVRTARPRHRIAGLQRTLRFARGYITAQSAPG